MMPILTLRQLVV